MFRFAHKLRTAIVLLSGAGLLLIGTSSTAYSQDHPDLEQQLARVRAATAKYHDVDRAIEDGFRPLPLGTPGICHGGPDGAVGISYINIPRFQSPTVDPEEPEFLNYIPTGDGYLRLVSVAYGNRIMFRDTRPPNTPGYLPGIFVWRQPVIPPYLEEVSGKFELFGHTPYRYFDGPWFYLMTAHIWFPNPDGVFADLNPKLRCP